MKKKNSQNLNKIVKGICIIALYFLFPMMIDSVLPSIPDSSTSETILRLFLNIVKAGIFIYVFIDCFKVEKMKPLRFIKKLMIYLVATIFLVGFSNGLLMNIIGEPIVSSNTLIVNEYLEKSMIFMFIYLLLICPITEEVVFRGLFKEFINNKWIYIIVSSLMFAIVNASYNLSSLNDILGMIPIFIGCTIRAHAYYKENNIYLPIAINFTYNLMVMAITLFA